MRPESGFISLLLLLLVPVFLITCEQEDFVENPSARLEFSTDTVFFDTVFTTIGSSTKRFTVTNPHQKKMRLSSITLAGGSKSDYRLNINGRPANRLEEVVIDAKDSLFVFVEVTIDPNQSEQPMVVKDSVVFRRKQQQQDVKLISWGQDVHLVRGERLSTQTWRAGKPYLVYDSARVAKESKLTIEAGTQVHFHRGAGLYVAGSLISNGTYEEPVVFQGDRPEEDYSDIPAQWDGIWLLPGSHDHVLRHTTVKNAITGIRADSAAASSGPALRLSKSRILHMSHAGIMARATSIKADNTLIADCGSYALALTQGGSYSFYHCTIANYWTGSTRHSASLLLNNHDTGTGQSTPSASLEKALFSNCIIYGNRTNEIDFDLAPGTDPVYFFSHCLIRKSQDQESFEGHSEKLLFNQDPLFKDPGEYDFRLDTLSPAINQGDTATANNWPADLLNNSRISDEGPDIGAFEFIPGSGSKR